jgi:hypothetical protein
MTRSPISKLISLAEGTIVAFDEMYKSPRNSETPSRDSMRKYLLERARLHSVGVATEDVDRLVALEFGNERAEKLVYLLRSYVERDYGNTQGERQ